MCGFCLFVCVKNCSCSRNPRVYTRIRLFNYVPAKVVRHLQKSKELHMDYIRAIERQQIREDIPQVRVADNVKVHYRIKEGDRERIQVFQGDVIRMAGAGARETFTVRKMSFGVGVERTFPLHSPKIAKLEVVRHGRVRRAKLYYLRDKVGKAARIPEKR